MSSDNDKSNGNNNKTYDIVIFGITGFTGKLAVEYLLEKSYPNCISWAACARNRKKAESALNSIVNKVNENKKDNEKVSLPPLLEADLICDTKEKEMILKDIVQSTRIVLTAAGPFEIYGCDLVRLCAEYGVGYCDTTGETSFFRKMIHLYDKKARETNACIIPHCGNDCIPQDLMVYEMYRYAKSIDASTNTILKEVKTYVEFPDSASFSGGTIHTAIYQLGGKKDDDDKKKKKDDDQPPQPEFDPLIMEADGTKSQYMTKNISPKSVVTEECGCGEEDAAGEDEKKKKMKLTVGPWIMGPVMVNCIRRSNALLHYNETFQYGDSKVKSSSLMAMMSEKLMTAKIAGAIIAPSIFGSFVPKPGDGPNRQTMEDGYMTLYGSGIMTISTTTETTETAEVVNADEQQQQETKKKTKDVELFGKFHFNKDVAYLYTAALLVECGMILLKKIQQNQDSSSSGSSNNNNSISGGILTPAVALGHDLTERIVQVMDATFEIKQLS